MALDIRQLLAQAKALPRTLKIVAVIAAIDLVILLLAAFTLEDEVDERIARVEQARGDLATLRAKIDTTRKEITRLPELRRKYDAAMSDGVLIDQDRPKLIQRAQDLSEKHRLSDLHYRLSPQQSSPGPSPALALVSTSVTLTSNALLDSDTLEFWADVLTSLQAHYQIDKATLERSDADTQTMLANVRAGRPAALVRSEVTFRWVSLRKVAPPGAPDAAKGAGAAPPVKAVEANAGDPASTAQ